MTRRRFRSCARGASTGYSLIEVLLASVVTAVVLAACWGWLWNVGALAARTDDGALARTAAAAALRAVRREVRLAVALRSPAPGSDPAHSLTLVHHHPGSATEPVLVCWDPARRVLWRNASGTYLSDQVTAFTVSYLAADGARTAGADLTAAGWSAVRAVHVDLAVVVSGSRAACSGDIDLGPA